MVIRRNRALDGRKPLVQSIGDMGEADRKLVAGGKHGRTPLNAYCIIPQPDSRCRDERQVMSNSAFKFDHVHIISKYPEASANWYV
jgi:hypothetical protein